MADILILDSSQQPSSPTDTTDFENRLGQMFPPQGSCISPLLSDPCYRLAVSLQLSWLALQVFVSKTPRSPIMFLGEWPLLSPPTQKHDDPGGCKTNVVSFIPLPAKIPSWSLLGDSLCANTRMHACSTHRPGPSADAITVQPTSPHPKPTTLIPVSAIALLSFLPKLVPNSKLNLEKWSKNPKIQ